MVIASWAPPLLLLAMLAPVGVIAAFAVPAGIGLALFAAIWQATLQSHVPDDQLSRLSSYDWLGSIALLPAGFLLAGIIEGILGPQGGLLGAGVVVILATLAMASVPSVRRLGLPPVSTTPNRLGRKTPARRSGPPPLRTTGQGFES
jgi:MFS family permease